MSCGSPVRSQDYNGTSGQRSPIHQHPYAFPRGLCCPLTARLYTAQDVPHCKIPLQHSHFSLPYEAESLKCFPQQIHQTPLPPYPAQMQCGITCLCPAFHGRKLRNLAPKELHRPDSAASSVITSFMLPPYVSLLCEPGVNTNTYPSRIILGIK